MKTYYDLTSKEKREYLKEFTKTPGGSDLNISRAIIDFVCMAMLLIFIMSETITENYLFELFLLIIPGIYNIYFNISFSCWLKNKHNIKRW